MPACATRHRPLGQGGCRRLARRCEGPGLHSSPARAVPWPPPQKLEAIARFIRERPVDAVLYLDRLDSWKIDTLDRKVGPPRSIASLLPGVVLPGSAGGRGGALV